MPTPPARRLFLVAEMHGLDHRRLLAHDYALINPLQVDSQFWADLPLESLVPRGAADAGHYPLLLEFARLATDGRVDLLDRDGAHRRHSRKPFFSALLRAPGTSKELAAHLRRQMVVKGPAPTRDQVLLRYYDPVVFRHLLWVLNPGQRSALMGGVTHWTWCDPRWGWQQYERENARDSTRRMLDQAQWDSLKRIGLLNRSLQHWTRSEPDLLEGHVDFYRRADALLGESWTVHKLQNEADRRQYAALELRHAGIHRHPHLVERLALVSMGAMSYADACGDLDPAGLLSLLADIDNRTVAMDANTP
ncbi:hypothetical protein CO641_04145 [Lysobacteraceae bacterium NML91-0213]|nr:hypothetical protein CO641_04145 [Xanthomonadaceae bacterium NML91-0213]